MLTPPPPNLTAYEAVVASYANYPPIANSTGSQSGSVFTDIIDYTSPGFQSIPTRLESAPRMLAIVPVAWIPQDYMGSSSEIARFFMVLDILVGTDTLQANRVFEMTWLESLASANAILGSSGNAQNFGIAGCSDVKQEMGKLSYQPPTELSPTQIRWNHQRRLTLNLGFYKANLLGAANYPVIS